MVDLVQERYTSSNGLDQGWRNVYCYLYPSPVDSNGTLQIKYIKFIDFGTAFDRSYDITGTRTVRSTPSGDCLPVKSNQKPIRSPVNNFG